MDKFQFHERVDIVKQSQYWSRDMMDSYNSKTYGASSVGALRTFTVGSFHALFHRSAQEETIFFLFPEDIYRNCFSTRKAKQNIQASSANILVQGGVMLYKLDQY